MFSYFQFGLINVKYTVHTADGTQLDMTQQFYCHKIDKSSCARVAKFLTVVACL